MEKFGTIYINKTLPNEFCCFFINTLVLVDLLRILAGEADKANYIIYFIYIISAAYIAFHAFINRRIVYLIFLALIYLVLVFFSYGSNEELNNTILNGSAIFLARGIPSLYVGLYINMDNSFFKCLKKYYVLVFAYIIAFLLKHNTDSYTPNYMVFSYYILFMTGLLIFQLINKPNWKELILSIILFFMMFIYGARGSLVCLVMGILFYCIYKFHIFDSGKKIFISLCGVMLIIFAWVSNLYNRIIVYIAHLFPNSRTLILIMQGEFTTSDARSGISHDLINEINKNWLKLHGLYADRVIGAKSLGISGDISGCHAHNTAIEILYQFGGGYWMPNIIDFVYSYFNCFYACV